MNSSFTLFHSFKGKSLHKSFQLPLQTKKQTKMNFIQGVIAQATIVGAIFVVYKNSAGKLASADMKKAKQ
eukprot:m.12381 g.12381  ORF g.12381 m.12381 type:complete len:70 (-) comp7181_c0_seq1:156-365(-)